MNVVLYITADDLQGVLTKSSPRSERLRSDLHSAFSQLLGILPRMVL